MGEAIADAAVAKIYATLGGSAMNAKPSNQALDARARRAAKKAGLVAKKTRWRAGTVDNFRGYQLIDVVSNAIVAGLHFDLAAEDVIAFCQARESH